MEIIFWYGAKFSACPEKFGPAPNILGPVEGRGISMQKIWTAKVEEPQDGLVKK